MKKKVIAAGHICLDITPVFPGEKVKKPEEILRPGKLIHMKEADVHTGGSVANTGLGLKFLGADVSLMGKVGADPFGDMVRNSLRQYQADKGMIIAEEESTSYSVILAIPGVDRIFLHNPGANDTFRASDISEEALQETALFHFGYPPLMRKMYQKNGKELCQLLQKAKKAGAATSLDMSSIDADAEAGKADWAEILKRIIPYVDFFVPSVEELCYMLDRERFASWQEMAGGQDVTEILDIEKDVRPLAEKCMELGAKVLLIKCGARGMYYRTAAGEKIAQMGRRVHLSVDDWAGKEGFEKSYQPERILSGTGAGDTSIAAFLAAMLEESPLNECVQLAAAEGASCVEAYDALSGLKSLQELRRKIAAGWKKAE